MSREVDLYKDKIEVSLDGRQIFYLFFGGAVIVGLVFVLGVMVGRRVEARGHTDHAASTATTDPLAALDAFESHKPATFQTVLAGAPPQPAVVDKRIEEIEKARVAEPPPAKKDKKPAADKKSEKKPEKVADKK